MPYSELDMPLSTTLFKTMSAFAPVTQLFLTAMGFRGLPWDSYFLFGASHGLPWSPNFEYLATWTHLKFHEVLTTRISWIWEWTLGSNLYKETVSPISKRKTPGQCYFGEVSERCHQSPRAGWEYHKWCRHKRHVQTECQNSVRKTKGPRQSVKIVSAHSGHKTRVSEKYQKISKNIKVSKKSTKYQKNIGYASVHNPSVRKVSQTGATGNRSSEKCQR